MTEAEPELPLVREILTYLPAVRGQSYALAYVAGEDLVRWDLEEAWANLVQRKELCRILGIQNYCDVDHDFKSRAFDVERLYFVPGQGIFISGVWTQHGLRLRKSFQGVSPASLDYSKKYPPPEKAVMAKKKQWEEDRKRLSADADWWGPIACICIEGPPTFPGTRRRFSVNGGDDSPESFLAVLNAEKLSYCDCNKH